MTMPLSTRTPIPFNRPYLTGREAVYMQEVMASRQFSGGGTFSSYAEQWLEAHTGARKALLTSSCTAALEMAALLVEAGPGDEIIMPSFTFVSCANAFALRGAKPVFVDIRADTLNIDERLIEAAITPRTKAIVVMHYAGVSCAMERIMPMAQRRGLVVIEDNAHGLLAEYKGRPLGSLGHLATLSFHETKNITCGQGGALLVNDTRFLERAYILRDKGTNRRQFENGQASHYHWVDYGSNYRLSELQAAFLYAQMEEAHRMTASRVQAWEYYHRLLKGHASLSLPQQGTSHNGHIFHVKTRDLEQRDQLIAHLNRRNISAHFHYVPLHRAPAYVRQFGETVSLPVTERVADTLIRLPMWMGIADVQEYIASAVQEYQPAIAG